MTTQYTDLISIDSRFRLDYDNSTTSDFSIALPKKIIKVKKMKLISSEVPITEYFFSSEKNNNIFTLIVYYNDQTEEINITIPDGIYFASDLNNYILNYFNNIDLGFNYLRYLYFSINEHSGKTVIRLKTQEEMENFNEDVETSDQINYLDGQNISFKLINHNTLFEESPLHIMGFSENQLSITFDTSDSYDKVEFSNTYQTCCISENIFGSVLNNYYYIVIDEISSDNNNISEARNVAGGIWYKTGWKAITNSGYTKNIIGKIQIKQATFNTNIGNSIDNTFNERTYHKTISITHLNIKIVNKYGAVVNLNNSDVAMALEFTINV
ncbi:MAG: hypothetical protein CBC91_00740 [Rickettsiales bacterium TMED131]|nr:MAG: hypothetical protein CBC91_00740 [Rickettsiales bacterium TMED131]|tara:strand:- start:949 stop:1926 length:978 start_codon:yes stop_codon:yes gene_type:complete